MSCSSIKYRGGGPGGQTEPIVHTLSNQSLSNQTRWYTQNTKVDYNAVIKIIFIRPPGCGDQHRSTWNPEAAVSKNQNCGRQHDPGWGYPTHPQRRVHGLFVPQHCCGWLRQRTLNVYIPLLYTLITHYQMHAKDQKHLLKQPGSLVTVCFCSLLHIYTFSTQQCVFLKSKLSIIFLLCWYPAKFTNKFIITHL